MTFKPSTICWCAIIFLLKTSTYLLGIFYPPVSVSGKLRNNVTELIVIIHFDKYAEGKVSSSETRLGDF